MTKSTAAPRASRAKVTSTGDRPRSDSFIHRKLDPQIAASNASRTVVDLRIR